MAWTHASTCRGLGEAWDTRRGWAAAVSFVRARSVLCALPLLRMCAQRASPWLTAPPLACACSAPKTLTSYEDGDKEDLDWKGLCDTLVDEATGKTRQGSRHDAKAAAAGGGGGGSSSKRASGVKRERRDAVEDEDEHGHNDRGSNGDDQAVHRSPHGGGGGSRARAEHKTAKRSTPGGKQQQQQKQKPQRQVVMEDPLAAEEEDVGMADAAAEEEERQQRRQRRRRQEGQDGGSSGGAEPPEEEEEAAAAAEREAQQRRKAKKQRRLQQQQQQQQDGEEPNEEMQEQEGGAAAAEREEEEEEPAEEFDPADLNARIERAVAASNAAARGAAAASVRERGLAGHVKAVRVVNFMCHEHFEMEFSSHVNFICGQNGSGKSAVLQALQICLGATARETGRGTNLRALIRSGCDEAVLRVTVWNTGDDAYQHERLGDWVTIERRIAKGGGAAANDAGAVQTTWRVLDQHGRVVKGATRRSLVDPLLDHLNVYADNPLCVMTQDRAREFLSSAAGSHRLLYKLFMDATMMGEFKAKLTRAQVRVFVCVGGGVVGWGAGGASLLWCG